MLTIHKVQALIEVEEGEFHAHQCERATRSAVAHQSMAHAFDWNRANGHIEVVGDQFVVTEKGKDLLHALTKVTV